MAKQKRKQAKSFRITKLKVIIFLILAAALGVSLIFSGFFESKIDSYLKKDYGDFKTATQQSCVFHMLNIGNGDCLALELPDGKKMLVDCGQDIKDKTYATKAVDYLTNVVFDGESNPENRVFDYMILTHPHDDHYNMAKTMFDNFNIKTVYRPAVFYYSDSYAAISSRELEYAKGQGFVDDSVSTLKNNTDVATISSANYKTFLDCVENEGSAVEFTYQGANGFTIENVSPNYKIKSYWPVQLNLGTDDLNIYSPIMIFNYNGHSICLTGDSVTKSEKSVAQNNTLPQVDVLKVGHHGSAGASEETFLNAIKPKYAFISCSANNGYGHPNAKALERIKASGVSENNILMTKDNGNLVFAVSNDSEGSIMVAASDGVTFV